MTFTATPTGHHAQTALLGLGYPADNADVTAETLGDLRALAAQLDQAMWFQAEVLRRRGESFQAIGDAMGISRQAVHKRLARWTD